MAYKRAGERLFAKAGSNKTRGDGFTLKEGRLRIHTPEKILGSVQGQMDFEQLGLGQGVPAHGKELK